MTTMYIIIIIIIDVKILYVANLDEVLNRCFTQFTVPNSSLSLLVFLYHNKLDNKRVGTIESSFEFRNIFHARFDDAGLIVMERKKNMHRKRF